MPGADALSATALRFDPGITATEGYLPQIPACLENLQPTPSVVIAHAPCTDTRSELRLFRARVCRR